MLDLWFAKSSRIWLVATFLALCVGGRGGAQSNIDPAQIVIRGRIIDRKAETALAGVWISATRGERPLAAEYSDSAGNFRLTVSGSASFVIHVRRLGYQPIVLRTDELRLGEPLSIAMVAVPATLDEVSVVATGWRSPRLRGFEERARTRAGGTYITRENIDTWQPRRTSDTMLRVLGARLWDSSGTIVVVSTRGEKVDLRKGVLMGNCVMRVGVDGHIKEWGFAIDMIDPSAIHGIEVYNGPATIPTEFAGMRTDSFCGLVMIWTRSGQ